MVCPNDAKSIKGNAQGGLKSIISSRVNHSLHTARLGYLGEVLPAKEANLSHKFLIFGYFQLFSNLHYTNNYNSCSSLLLPASHWAGSSLKHLLFFACQCHRTGLGFAKH